MKSNLCFIALFISFQCLAQRDKDNVLDYISGPKDQIYFHGDSIQKAFFKLNDSRVQDLNKSFSKLPIDRCHHGKISIGIEIDSAGKTTNVQLLNKSENIKLDSMIVSCALNQSGDWQTLEQNGIKAGFKGVMTFILLNGFAKVSSERTEGTTTDSQGRMYNTISYNHKKEYNSTKACEDAEFFYNKGISDFKDGEFKKARYDFKTALSSNSYDLDILFNLAITDFKLNNIKEGCDCLKKAFEYGDPKAGELFRTKCETKNK